MNRSLLKKLLGWPAGVVLSLALAYGLGGCGTESSTKSNENFPDGLTLMSLKDNQTLTYLQTDTVYLFDPYFEVNDTTYVRTIGVAIPDGGTSLDRVILDDQTPVISLRITDGNILVNGYYNDIGGVDSLFPFHDPAIIMPRQLGTGRSWEAMTEPYSDSGASRQLPFYFANYGFYCRKTFVGTAHLLLTNDEYNTYQFDLELFTAESDSIPIATATEYYAPSVGLVKLIFRGGSLIRVLTLLESL